MIHQLDKILSAKLLGGAIYSPTHGIMPVRVKHATILVHDTKLQDVYSVTRDFEVREKNKRYCVSTNGVRSAYIRGGCHHELDRRLRNSDYLLSVRFTVRTSSSCSFPNDCSLLFDTDTSIAVRSLLSKAVQWQVRKVSETTIDLIATLVVVTVN